MARFDSDGGRVATTIFEAAAWHRAVKPICSRCTHSAVFHPHALWWRFHRRGWDDSLMAARERFWCRKCGERIGQRIRPRVLELVPEGDGMVCLAMPPQHEWKRAVSRFRS